MNKISDESGGGLIRGVCFESNDVENIIKVWISSMSGMERIYFNEVLVSEKRSTSLKSECDFVIDGDEFKVNIEVINIINGKLLCILSKNNTVIKKLGCKFNKVSYGFVFMLIIIMSFVLYAIFGMYIDIPKWGLILFITLVFAFKFFMSKKDLFFVYEV